jgi:hypothetical protein
VVGWPHQQGQLCRPAAAHGRIFRHLRQAARAQAIPQWPHVLVLDPTQACRTSAIGREPAAFRAQALDLVSEIARICRIAPDRETAQHYRIVPARETAQHCHSAPDLTARAPLQEIVRTSTAVPAWAINLAEAAVRHRVTWVIFLG